MRHVNARVCTRTAISYFNQSLLSTQSIPRSRSPPGGGPFWAYLPHLPLESEAREGRNEPQAMQAFMRVCVCSNHPISPLIIVQSSNLSLYSMFALLHGEFTSTRDKQCACCVRSKQNLYVYTWFFEFIWSFLNSFFFIAPRSKRGIFYVFYLLCVSSFSYYYVTYCYNLIFFVFSGAQLGCAPARRFSLRVNPGILKFL